MIQSNGLMLDGIKVTIPKEAGGSRMYGTRLSKSGGQLLSTRGGTKLPSKPCVSSPVSRGQSYLNPCIACTVGVKGMEERRWSLIVSKGSLQVVKQKASLLHYSGVLSQYLALAAMANWLPT